MNSMVLLFRKIKFDPREFPDPFELVAADVSDSKIMSPFLVNTITVNDELIGMRYSLFELSMTGVLKTKSSSVCRIKSLLMMQEESIIVTNDKKMIIFEDWNMFQK